MEPTEVIAARINAALDDAEQASGQSTAQWLVDLQRIQARVSALVCRSFTDAGPASVIADETGHRSVADLVAARSGASPRTVRADSQLGVWLIDYPELAAAFGAGRLGKAHVEAIRARENPRSRPHLFEAQNYLIEAAQTCQWSEFLAVLRYWELAADPDGEEPVEQHEARAFSYQKRADGSVSGRFTLDPVSGQSVLGAIECQVQRLFRADAEDGSMRTASQRRADALVEAVTGPSRAAGAQPLIHVVISEAVVADHLKRLADPVRRSEPLGLDYSDPINSRCEFIDGTPVHPSYALASMATAVFRRLVLDPESEITDLGRDARCFPPRLKQALLVKARGRCQHPGCDAPISWMQADHVLPWSRDGSTSLANGQILCDPHNKLKRDRPPQLE